MRISPSPATEAPPTSYPEFSLDSVARVLGITTREEALFPGLAPLGVSAWLAETLGRRTKLALISEKARSESIVAPILSAIRDLSPGPLAIFSGQRLDVDPARGLVGECDFLLANAQPVPPLRAPLAAVVEAKKNDIEASLGQCIAQMVGARLFNAGADRGDAPVFGCVTTGEDWQFLKLGENEALIDRDRFYIDNVGGILAAFRAIVLAGRGAG